MSFSPAITAAIPPTSTKTSQMPRPSQEKRLPSPQKLGRKRERDAEVQRREDEKRNDLEQDDSTVVTHWAP